SSRPGPARRAGSGDPGTGARRRPGPGSAGSRDGASWRFPLLLLYTGRTGSGGRFLNQELPDAEFVLREPLPEGLRQGQPVGQDRLLYQEVEQVLDEGLVRLLAARQELAQLPGAGELDVF